MLRYIALGIIQGVTEFLPVSSSAHLVIMQKIFGMQGEEIALSVALHLGTICALIIFLFKDIIGAFKNKNLLFYIFVTTLITGCIGIAGKDFFESLFSDVKLIACSLAVTGIFLILTKKAKDNNRYVLNIKDAVSLGFVQAISVIPGISRSGATISTLLFRKVNRDVAFKFSFLISIPAVLGATLLEAKKIGFAIEANFFNFFLGFIFSIMSGLISLWVLRLALRKAKLYYFGYYCIFAAVITFLFIR